jgi:CRISPR-associated protein Csb1
LLRRYVLGLSLVAACEPAESFLRQGCLVTLDPASAGQWDAVERRGTRVTFSLTDDIAADYAKNAAKAFGVGKGRQVTFSKELASSDPKENEKKKSSKKGKTGA